MEIRAFKRECGTAVVLATACFALALWSTACGGGGTTQVSVSTAGFSINPAGPLTFGNVAVGTTSALPGSATLTNVGNATLTFSSIEVMGTNPGDFTLTSGGTQNPCPYLGGSLVAGASCTISATFTPSAAGVRTANVVFSDNAAGSPQSVTLTGTGTAPGVGLSTTTITFGSQLVGTSAPSQTVTLTNSGGAALSISSIVISGANVGDFGGASPGNTCGNSVASNGTCTITIPFTPTASGSRTATLTISDNASGSPQTVSISGTGTSPAITLTPNTMTFTGITQGTSSSQSVTLTNTGNATLTISSITVASSVFALTNGANPCPYTGGTVLASASCTITVTFTPSSATTFNSFVIIASNAPGAAPILSVTGTGAGNAGVAALSPPTALTFGSQSENVATSLPVTLTNTGNANLNIASIVVMGGNGFTVPASPCTTPLAPLAMCTITVTFTPPSAGNLNATLVITDDSGNPGVETSVQNVALSGTGTASQVSLSPSPLIFIGQAVGTSVSLPITLTNTGNANLVITPPLTITGTNAGDFSQTNTCGTTVAANGGSCAVNVTFTPSAPLTRTAVLTVTDNAAAGATQTMTLTGTGIGPAVTLTATSLTFTAQNLGTTSAAQPVTLTNTGNGSLSITSLALSGASSSDYSLSGSTCSVGAPVAAGGTCTINVFFTPATTGTLAAQVNIVDNATTAPSPSPQTISLSGSGTGPVVGLSGTSLTFTGSVAVGSTAGLPLTVTNNGNTSLSITGVQITGANSGDFSVTSSTCGSAVAPASTCTITVTFAPTAPGSSLTATLTLTDNSSTSPQSVTLTGTGTGPVVNPSSLTLNFPTPQNVGTTSGALSISLGNSGNASLTLNSIVFSNPSDFTLASGAGQCVYAGGTVGAGSSCTIYVTFTPTVPGARSATITITDNTDNVASSQQTVSVTGTGSGPAVTFTPPSLTFSSQTQGTASAPQSIMLSNTGNANLTITGGITITGPGAADYALSNNTCGGVVTVGNNCSFNVTFTPQGTGTLNAAISVTDNASPSTQTANLTGSGVSGIQLAPSSVNFTAQNVATTSAPSVVTVTNTGTTNLTFGTLTNSDPTDFPETNTCANATVTPGNFCKITVTFTPQSPGSLASTVSIADNLNTSPQTLSITGTANGSTAALSTGLYTFATGQNLNTTSAAVAVGTVTNNGNQSLTITSIVSSDTTEFTLVSGANVCPYIGGSLGIGASCTIYATFGPTTEGTRVALVTFTDNANPGSQTMTLSGTGLAPEASITPVSQTLTFTPQTLGVSTTQTFTLTNTGNAPLTVSGPALGGANPGDFQVTPCGTSLAANGGACTVTVTFLPISPGPLAATVTITDNSNGVANTTQTVTLSGTGNGPSPNLAGATLSFGSQTLGTTVTNSMMLSNPVPANVSLTINSGNGIAISGANAADFSLASGANACALGGAVAIGSNCLVYVSFKPTLTSTENATVTITDNGDPTTQTFALVGTGTGSVVSLSSTSVTFPGQAVTTPATAGSAIMVTVTNTGNVSLTITGITLSGTNSGDFNQTNNCPISPATLPAMGSGTNFCTISVTFAPTNSGTRTASISIADNATAGSPQSIALSGTGTVGAGQVSATSLNFGSYSVGQSSQGPCSPPLPNSNNCVTLSNTGGSATLTITNIALGGANANQFAIYAPDTTCAGSLAINASCIVDVTFAPTTASITPSTFSGTLTFTDSAPSSPQVVTLTGSGTAPEAGLSPASFGFLGTPDDTPSATETFVLTNTGNATLNLNTPGGISYTGADPGDFSDNTTCGTTVAQNSFCNIVVTFTPGGAGSRSGNLVVTDNSNNVANTTQISTLTGTGIPDIVLNWDPSPTSGILGYNIFRGMASGGEGTTPIATEVVAGCTSLATCTYADTNVTANVKYFYVVTAVASNGITQSTNSNEASATAP